METVISNDDPDIIGEARNHDELVAVLRERKAALQLSDQVVDHLGGLAAGHTGKLLGAVPIKMLGRVSLSALLGALALKLVVVVDAEQAKRISSRWIRRSSQANHPTLMTIRQARPLILSRSAQRAAKAKWAKMTPEQRQEHCTKMRAARAKPFARKE